jgi:hypothetical protein
MDAFSSVSATSAAWLRDSVFAPFVPAYVDHLTSRQYAAGTTRAYLGRIPSVFYRQGADKDAIREDAGGFR